MFKKILILSIIASVAVAGNPDAPGYFEPRLTIGAGEGVIRSDMLESDMNWDTSPRDIGIGLKALTPINDYCSMTLLGNFTWSRFDWSAYKKNTKVFQFSIGMRFYLKGD